MDTVEPHYSPVKRNAAELIEKDQVTVIVVKFDNSFFR